MSRIHRTDFVQAFQGRSISLSKLDGEVKDRLWEAGASGWGVSQADLNRDGKISGTQETQALFDYVDTFDRNGSYNSINTTTAGGRPTASGKIMSLLDLMVERSRSTTPLRPTQQTDTTSWQSVSTGTTTLREGMRGPAVSSLQTSLRELGFTVGEEGVFDGQTRRGVQQFQAAHGLSQDGEVGQKTAGRMEWEGIRQGHRQLAVGSEGEAVRMMQEALTQAGFGVQTTGVFGPTTQETLLAFQRAKGIQPTGIFGPTTMAGIERTSGSGELSASSRQQMRGMLSHAKRMSQGYRPDGRCYFHVANFLDAMPYGKLGQAFNNHVPSSHFAEARMFAEWMNQGNNAANAGLQKLDIDNPYDAPPGAIVVVRAGTPGTAHPTAGDIAIKGDGNIFYNGGDMRYGGRHNFPPGNDLVLGIYVPA